MWKDKLVLFLPLMILMVHISHNWQEAKNDITLSVYSEVASETFADLHPVEGIRGVFIASQLVSDFSKIPSRLRPEHLSSLITFNQGAQWKPLQPPQKDAFGNPINCKRVS